MKTKADRKTNKHGEGPGVSGKGAPRRHQSQRGPQVSGSLGGLLDGFRKLIETAGELQKSGFLGKVGRTGEFTIPGLGDKGGSQKGIFGFSIRTMAGGDSGGVTVQPFGNVRKTPQGGMSVEEAREPVVDVIEEGNRVRVIVELPGARQGDIHHELNGDVLRIWTDGDRHYDAEVVLPAGATLQDAQTSFKNGILDMKLTKG